MHHAHVDSDKDPHDATRGFWWSHLFWMCVNRNDINDLNLIRKYARDISADPFLNAMTNPLVQILSQVALGLVFLAIGGWSWVVWGIFVRLVVVYHVTWLVNSACHMFGYRNYESKDISTNCWWVGLLACGEGWHNNHHAQQDVAPAGHKWWEFDITWQLIKVLRKLGWAYDVKLPRPIEAAQPIEQRDESSTTVCPLPSVGIGIPRPS
jgi:stearoyl-CoA desaturase (delta-9 desaturase)